LDLIQKKKRLINVLYPLFGYLRTIYTLKPVRLQDVSQRGEDRSGGKKLSFLNSKIKAYFFYPPINYRLDSAQCILALLPFAAKIGVHLL